MKGILFKPDMIQAIVEGRKTQTRRVIKPQPRRIDDAFDGTWEWKEKGHYYDDLTLYEELRSKPPYQVGETVYIKEKIWRIGEYAIYYSDSKPVMFVQSANRLKWRWQRQYLSPIHLPYEAARYFVLIEDVRAERLQEISEEDAWLEGFPLYTKAEHKSDYLEFARECFGEYWDSLNKDYPWESNPWVFKYEFERNI